MISPYYILIFVTLSSFVYGLIGFGDALILMPIISPIIGIHPAAILTNTWGFFPATINLIQYRKYIDWKFVGKVLLAATPGAIIGAFLFSYIPPRILEIILGIFIVIFAVIKLYFYLVKKKEVESEEPQQDRKFPEFLIYLGGFSNGFLASVISAAGPINVALLESSGHHRESLIANFAAILLPLTVIRVILYFINGVFPTELWLVFVLAIPIILIFTKLGHLLTPKIPIKVFQIIVLLFLIVVGIMFFF
ncbi:MAG: sulfite exporter TauE/SafE family protein [Promethearchaeota archaeon]